MKTESLTRIRRILLITLLISVISYHPGANEKPDIVAEKLATGNVRLTNKDSSGDEFADCDRMIESFLHKWKIAGASVAIARDGRLIFAKGYGYADTVEMTEIQPYNRFRIASISKLVTAVGIMKLHEEGKLLLDNRVFGAEGILDDPFFSNPADKRVYNINVAHLLSHQAGWTQRYGDHMFMPEVVAKQMGIERPVDLKTIIRFALNKRLHFTPGAGKAYSNLGYAILGLIIEKVSGLSYEEYCRQQIFEPLGIYDMALAANLPSKKALFEVTYYEPPGVLRKPSIYGTNEMLPPSYGGNDIETLGGAGAWLATAPDLMRLLLAIDGFETRKDILSEESIRFMTDNNNGFAPVGWRGIIYNGTWWRTGSFPGTAGMLKRQSDGVAWVVLLNSSAWNGPEINTYINNMMSKVIYSIKEWPNRDLFEYSLPLPLKDYNKIGLIN